MNKRKLFGTIIGLIFWSVCIMFFTYAYYDWRSVLTNVVLGIEDLSVECLVGADVNVTNIGPVLDNRDGVNVEFSINNSMVDNMTIELYLNIDSISSNLLNESFKYMLVSDITGGINYDYTNPILEGDFRDFNTGNNLITKNLEVLSGTTTNYQFILYIDGSIYNSVNVQENDLLASLVLGKCNGNLQPSDQLVYQAVYSKTDESLTFVYTTPLSNGDIYNDKAITAVYTGFDTGSYGSYNSVPWYKDGNYENIETVSIESVLTPENTAFWFYGFNRLKNIDLEKLDTSRVINMNSMFYGCSNLVTLELDTMFDTSNVLDFSDMFRNCSSLTSAEITIKSNDGINPIYSNMFLNSATKSGASVTVYYDSNTKSLVVSMVSTKSSNSNVIVAEDSTYRLLNEFPVGSYVKYIGDSANGCDNTNIVDGYTSCSGKNANYESDTNMGYCQSSSYNFTLNGWRIGYIDDGNVHLISAGATDCMCSNSDGTFSDSSCSDNLSSNDLYKHFNNMNSIALKYCNADYAKGGVCDETTVWAMNAFDFEKITGSVLDSSSCFISTNDEACGYGNDLVDNGGYYWFATPYSSSSYATFHWYPPGHSIYSEFSDNIGGIRPVLVIDSSIGVIGGSGTYSDPYIMT